MCNDKEYTLYHCFAGDNPAGIITQDKTVLEQVGESLRSLNVMHNDPNIAVILKWYNEDTNNCTEYEQTHWCVSKD